MGMFTASAPAQLHPVNPPLGVHGHYCMPHPTTLVLKEKAFSFSGDDFAVKDQNGQVVVRCKGQAFSFRDRKVITDPNGRLLYGLRNKLMSIHKTYIGEDEQEREIFRIRKKISMSTRMEATFINHSTRAETTLELRGDFWGGSADIHMVNGPIVAQISRQMFNARELFTDKQTYFVTAKNENNN
ncbi:hypothetical protein CI109_102700 [Kwoniella shandongensis]|uniref:Uncharacterized protein n=1 Tax=Kwoniella shandongensis TaxID=1734106 RepID=A0AAJ8MW59_9TREE